MAQPLSVYDITIKGTSQGVSFQRQGKIYIYSTVTSVTENGVNPLDVFIESGFPAGSPAPGAIWLSTNNALFPGAGSSALDMAYVSTSTNQINIQPDSRISAVQGNNFTVRSGLLADTYLIVGGTATLQFQNNQQNIVGNINIIGKGFSFSTNTPYQATITGTLSQGTPPLLQGTLPQSKTEDFDKDGNSDILMSNASQGWSGLYTMKGTAVSSWVGLPYSGGAVATGSGDLNKDGDTDILMSNASQGWSGFYTMKGTSVSGWVALPYAAGAVATGSGDFNKDGNTDILMSNASQGWSGFYTMNGTAVSSWVSLPYSSGAVATGSGDFNKDGNTDILMSNASQGWSGFYTMKGTSVSGWVSLPYSSGAVATGTGDFNKDGNTDILMSNASQGWSGFYTMNGTTVSSWVGLPYSGGAVAM